MAAHRGRCFRALRRVRNKHKLQRAGKGDQACHSKAAFNIRAAGCRDSRTHRCAFVRRIEITGLLRADQRSGC